MRVLQDPQAVMWQITAPHSPPRGVDAGTAPPVPLNRVFLRAHSLLAADAHSVLCVRDMSNYVLFIQG